MPEPQHLLERRAALLGSKLRGRIDAISQALSPKGQRAPFTVQLSQREALNWWRAHLGDNYGAQMLAQMDPASQIELRRALAEADEPQVPQDAAMQEGTDGF